MQIRNIKQNSLVSVVVLYGEWGIHEVLYKYFLDV
jgi:hypothetical protein